MKVVIIGSGLASISAAKVVFAEVPLAANGANRAVISAAGDAAIVVTFAKLPPRDVMSLTAFKADAVADVSVGVSVNAFVLPLRIVIAANVLAAAGATVAVIVVAGTVLSDDASAAVI